MTKREEGTVAEPTSTQATGEDEDLQPEEGAEAAPSEYTTETSAEAGRRAAARPVVTGRAMGTGRRKEAIARVRIAPGTGQWLVNDRPLEKFFPNKVHQQLISEPLVTLGAEGQFDIVARVSGGGVAGQAGALPDPRRPGHGAQEVWAEEGPEGTPVLQALAPGIGAQTFPATTARRQLGNAPWAGCSARMAFGG